ncbi:hypothetical protein CISG_01235 [Coccidioides immitis RMSCC 3703]|uniref:Uncharacterized protein n=2 Tax=Coccidioides immitis TaxID=5501 RepID=A0A0J8TRW8_COCIT|nr:hypothetical protein CIRG_01661 [Coccidioides immitis RMSCC 2394]KMU76502.1 hypothetical protein CISG_01235 [Coccidioides immitis RMSCC 3703]
MEIFTSDLRLLCTASPDNATATQVVIYGRWSQLNLVQGDVYGGSITMSEL